MISQQVVIPTYLLVISLTYCLCLYWLYVRASHPKHQANISLMLDLCLVIMICGLIGARALHIFYEDWGYYQSDPSAIFKIWQGGFIYYGGFLAAVAGSAFFLRRKNESFLKWADFFAPVLALGYALGRIGCFLNGCCFGQACVVGATCDLPWMIEFHHAGLPEGLRHPTQLYATFSELVTLAIVLSFAKYRSGQRAGGGTSFLSQPGLVFALWLTLHAVGRLVMEHYREDYRGPEIAGMSLSMLLSYGLILVTFLVVLFKFLTIRRGQHSS